MTFIVFEGLNKTGKTSIINVLKKDYEKQGLKIGLYKEPVLSNPFKDFYKYLDVKIDNDVLFFLLTFNRLHGQKTLAKLIKENDIVICDRYFYSTLAYQVLGKRNSKLLKEIILLDNLFIVPDIIFHLKIDTFNELKIIERRMPDKPADELESITLEKKLFIAHNYKQIFSEYHSNKVFNVDVITKDFNSIVDYIKQIIFCRELSNKISVNLEKIIKNKGE